jgi:GGDEF domain-containing protein
MPYTPEINLELKQIDEAGISLGKKEEERKEAMRRFLHSKELAAPDENKFAYKTGLVVQKAAGAINRAAGEVLAPDYKYGQPQTPGLTPQYPSTAGVAGVQTSQPKTILAKPNFKSDIATGIKTGFKQGAEELVTLGKGITSLPYVVGSGWGQAAALPFGQDKAEAVGKWFEDNRQNAIKTFGIDVAQKVYELSEQDMKALQESGLVGNTLAIATQTAMSLPSMIAAGGIGQKLMAGSLAQIGPEGLQKALPTIYKIFKNDAAAVKFITESANMAAGFGAKGFVEGSGISPEESFKQGAQGIATAPFYLIGPAVGKAITPVAASPLLKAGIEYAGAGTGMALPTALTGGNPAQIMQAFLTGMGLHGAFKAIAGKPKQDIDNFIKDPTPENKTKAEEALKGAGLAEDFESARALVENSRVMSEVEIKSGLESLKDPRVRATAEGMIKKSQEDMAEINRLNVENRTEPMTGLGSLRAYQEAPMDKSTATLKFDLDGLKKMNDSKGKPYSNRVWLEKLEAVKVVLKEYGIENIPDKNLWKLFREGGDEHSVIPNRPELDAKLPEIGERMRKVFNETSDPAMTITVGIGKTPELAEQTVSLAKYRGKNMVLTDAELAKLTPEERTFIDAEMAKRAEEARKTPGQATQSPVPAPTAPARPNPGKTYPRRSTHWNWQSKTQDWINPR